MTHQDLLTHLTHDPLTQGEGFCRPSYGPLEHYVFGLSVRLWKRA